MSDRQNVARVIKATAAYYGKLIEPEVLTMMCNDLEDLDPLKVIEAYERYRKSPRNRHFPLPSDIRELVNPGEFVAVEARAREIAARVVGAVTKYGWNNGTEAMSYIGPEGWAAVEIQGGWRHICENLGTNMQSTTFQAQVRDQVEGLLRYGADAIEKSIGALSPGRIRSGELTAIGDIARLLPSQDPDGAA